MPEPLAKICELWHQDEISQWRGRTCGEVLDELIGDPKLRAVLLAQRANYGGMTPSRSSFGIHAVMMHHYFNGGYYPIGGAEVFANSLIPVIERAGGTIKLRAGVRELLVEDGHVAGTRLEHGTEIRAPRVFSDAGARNTVGMLPSAMRESEWAREILSLAPSVCHFGLYLGLEGDIRANGASPSNHWIYESWNTK